MKKFTLLCATSALVMPASAFAQTTGSQEVEQPIVVTGSRAQRNVGGVVAPDTTRAQAVLTSEIIQRQAPGQSVLNTINLIPGVNFTNNDPYGSSGGSIRIRGFEGNRISLTFDGLPLNDTGNYAIYSNQQLDPELIEQVNVNLGQTEIDSPTASAAGGTVNYRTRIPGIRFGVRGTASYGENDFHRIFGMIDSGELTSFGTRGFVSYSNARHDQFRGPGEIYKQQGNFRLYQPIGSGRDFVSLSGHYNRNRNAFYRNPSINDLRSLFGATVIAPAAAISSANPLVIGGFTEAQDQQVFDFNNLATCVRVGPTPGTAGNEGSGAAATCSNFFGLRINPSNTGNLRVQSRFTLAEGLILTVDPSFQYTLANGGGTQVLRENAPQLGGNNSTSNPQGVDLNGDGDFRDSVRLYTPNNTNTRRYGLTSSLIWDLNNDHRLRFAYTFDYGRHRQTGEYGFLDVLGRPENVFGGRNGTPVAALNGSPVQGRDRLSIASLHQIGGQYIGQFMDDRLRVELGLRAPFFKRELNQNCFTNISGSSVNVGGVGIGGGFTLCAPITAAQAAAISPNLIAPFERDYEFNALLPNVGARFQATDAISIFGSFAKGLSAPRTDNLYRRVEVDLDPETTEAFDLGARFTSRQVQAQLTGWKINYQNRIITSFDPELGFSLDRNVGRVNSHGFDGSVAFRPIPEVTLYAFGSYIEATFQEDVQIGNTSAPTGGATVPAGTPIFAPTRGRSVSETPEWQLGGRAQLNLGPLELGFQGKWVDDRFATDVNDVIVRGYTLFDLDARLAIGGTGMPLTYLQLNVINLFNERYFGGISTQINAGNICPVGATCGSNGANPNFTVGSPRTVLVTANFGF